MEDYTGCDALGTAKFFIMGEKWKEARAALDLVRPYCENIRQLDAIGKCYAEARDWQTTFEIAKQLYDTISNKNEPRASMIRALLNMNRPAEALEYIDEHEWSDETSMEQAMALFMLNRKPESEKVLRGLLQSVNKDIRRRAEFNLATHDIANGKFKQGLRTFLLRSPDISSHRKSPLPKHNEWTGQAQPGRTLTIIAEGGIGDEIINVRFMKHVRKLGMLPIWNTDRKDLAEVFERNGFPCVDTLNGLQNDLWCYSMQLPVLLDLDEDQLWDGSYLTAKHTAPPLPQVWADPIIHQTRPRVGLKTSGNSDYEQDLHRTLPFSDIAHVLGSFDISAYDFGLEFGRKPPLGSKTTLTEVAWWVGILKPLIKTWDDTFDYLSQMDIVVTSCTSIAHAASAMGKKTVVLVPIMNYYIWAKPGDHSPWYGENTTIIRQTEPGNWDKPLAELKDYLAKNI
jgi:hypothetical protein